MSKELAAQQKLQQIGLLDPPADGIWGLESQGAIRSFAKLIDKPDNSGTLTNELFDKLEEYQVTPVSLQNDLAGKITKMMKSKLFWMSRGAKRYNIIYIEGMNSDGTLNNNEPNKWNDLRLLVEIENSIPKIAKCWTGTTEPGKEYTHAPLDASGAFRIAFGQYKAWQVGDHHGHPALVQVSPITGYRDKNEDFKRDGDTVVVGNFGINQHRGNNANVVSLSSAGCLVGQTHAGHDQFMQMVKEDPRYVLNHGYRFMTTVISGHELSQVTIS